MIRVAREEPDDANAHGGAQPSAVTREPVTREMKWDDYRGLLAKEAALPPKQTPAAKQGPAAKQAPAVKDAPAAKQPIELDPPSSRRQPVPPSARIATPLTERDRLLAAFLSEDAPADPPPQAPSGRKPR